MMIGLIEDLIRWIEPAYKVAGYAIVSVGVLAERSILIGLFVPGDIILALGGIYAAQGDLELWAVMLIGTVAALCGESIGYWLGRKYGRSLLKRIPLLRRLDDRLENAEDYFHRHGGKTVAIGRYATAAGAFIPFVAGIGRMDYKRFLAFDVPAVVLWATGITLFGYFFNDQIDFVDKVLSRFGLIMLAVVAAFLGAHLLYKRRQRRS